MPQTNRQCWNTTDLCVWGLGFWGWGEHVWYWSYACWHFVIAVLSRHQVRMLKLPTNELTKATYKDLLAQDKDLLAQDCSKVSQQWFQWNLWAWKCEKSQGVYRINVGIKIKGNTILLRVYGALQQTQTNRGVRAPPSSKKLCQSLFLSRAITMINHSQKTGW